MSEVIGVLQAAEEKFLKFVDEIQQNKIGQISVRRALKKYDVKNLKINNVTSLRAKKMFSAITPKYVHGANCDKSWLQNERRLFIWCTLCYLHKNSIEINDLKASDFQFLRSIFPLKELDLIKFQVYSLVKKDNKSSGWKQQQDDLLRNLIQKQDEKTIQWSNIAKQFFSQSGQKFFRNAKQCRERWLNYLDPKKEKGKWQSQQDKILLKEVLNKGKKWSKIVQALDGKKNQHMIKNRYKSLIHKKEKACRSSKINENELIKMILKDYNEEIKQNSASKQQDQSQNENQFIQNEDGSSIQEQEQNQHENTKIKQTTIQNTLQVKKEQKKQVKPTNFFNRWKTGWPIIVEATVPQVNPEQNVQKAEQAVKQSPLLINEVEICGDKAGKQLISNLFFSVNPNEENNRINNPFQSRSPASNVFLASPYPAACWTPSLFFMQDSQIAPSPLGGFGDFSTKTRSFTNFIADNNEKRN